MKQGKGEQKCKFFFCHSIMLDSRLIIINPFRGRVVLHVVLNKITIIQEPSNVRS